MVILNRCVEHKTYICNIYIYIYKCINVAFIYLYDIMSIYIYIFGIYKNIRHFIYTHVLYVCNMIYIYIYLYTYVNIAC